jgi:hypothetical protein
VPVIKEVIELDYVGVIQEPLQLDFACDLLDYAFSFVE